MDLDSDKQQWLNNRAGGFALILLEGQIVDRPAPGPPRNLFELMIHLTRAISYSEGFKAGYNGKEKPPSGLFGPKQRQEMAAKIEDWEPDRPWEMPYQVGYSNKVVSEGFNDGKWAKERDRKEALKKADLAYKQGYISGRMERIKPEPRAILMRDDDPPPSLAETEYHRGLMRGRHDQELQRRQYLASHLQSLP